MSSAPGTTVSIINTPRRRVARTDTGEWFVVGLADQGPLTPVAVTSLDEFVAAFGGRVSYSLLYDAMEAFFSERGTHAWVSRVVGPAAVAAGHDFSDSTPATTLRVAAKGPGTYGNNLLAQIVVPTTGQFQIVVSNAAGTLETSPVFTVKNDAVNWSQFSPNIVVTSLAGTGLPVAAAATALTGGADDRTNITDTQWQAALDLFPSSYGPGQVSMPGRATSTAWTQLLTHAVARNRFALLDAPDTPTVSSLTSSAATLRALGSQSRAGQFLAPWGVGPGLVANQTRDIPPCAVQAGIYARNDATGVVGLPAAGDDHGTSLFLVGVKQTWVEADRATLSDAGVNVIRNFDGVIETFADRTLTDPATDTPWLQAHVARLVMDIKAQAKAIGDRHLWRLIDGQGFEIGDFRDDLTAMLTRRWLDRDLFGATASEAFTVDVDPPVNTTATIANRELHANIGIKATPGAEQVFVQIGNTALTEAF